MLDSKQQEESKKVPPKI